MTEDEVVGECGACAKPAQLRCSGCRMVAYCDVNCQKEHRQDHKDNCRSWEERLVEGRGRGLFARRCLAAGELLLKEKPLLTMTTPHTPKTLAKYVAELRQKVRALPEEKVEDFFQLSIARPEICTKDRTESMMMGIFQTNSIIIRELDKLKGKELGAAVYPKASRLNHSCAPNVAWSFDAVKNVIEVRAVRSIDAGEELQVCYIDPVNMAEDRGKLLKARYNFQCRCKVCALPPEELQINDKVRREILGLGNNLEDVYREQPVKALRFAKMRLERIEKMGVEMIEILPQAYMDCYELCLVQNEKEIAEIFANRGSEVAKRIRGKNSLWSKVK